VQNGKKVMREKNYFPGYVMMEVQDGKLMMILYNISAISAT
jgi:transcriptional antiterminator NusG